MATMQPDKQIHVEAYLHTFSFAHLDLWSLGHSMDVLPHTNALHYWIVNLAEGTISQLEISSGSGCSCWICPYCSSESPAMHDASCGVRKGWVAEHSLDVQVHMCMVEQEAWVAGIDIISSTASSIWSCIHNSNHCNPETCTCRGWLLSTCTAIMCIVYMYRSWMICWTRKPCIAYMYCMHVRYLAYIILYDTWNLPRLYPSIEMGGELCMIYILCTPCSQYYMYTWHYAYMYSTAYIILSKAQTIVYNQMYRKDMYATLDDSST
jgi:hypothetical protein